MTDNQDLDEILKPYKKLHCTWCGKRSFDVQFDKAKLAIQAYCDRKTKEAFRNGQLDCRKAGDPCNHVHFEEACASKCQESRVDELEKLEEHYETEHILNSQDTKRYLVSRIAAIKKQGEE
jgi:hypothetical protein